MKKIIKNNYLIILSFLIPLSIMTLLFILKEGFTKNIIGQSDMIYQYIPFFNYLKSLATNFDIYTFKSGIASSMYSTIFYYLSSPLNIVFILLKDINVIDIIPYLIVLKIGLCGLTMFIYLKHHYKETKTSMLIFSTCYALMAYNINYYFNIMWIDIVFLAPLVLLGLDKLMDENKASLYIVTLFLAILSNYYIAYMLCLFIVIYLVRYLILNYNNKKDTIKKIINFIVISLFTGLMCSFIIIPTLYELSLTAKGISRAYDLNFNFDFNILSKLFMGTNSKSDILNENYMCLYSGLIILPLIYFYFKNKNISLKEKIVSLMIIIIMVLPYFIPVFNLLWHGFKFPICFNYRYSFLLNLYLIIIAYKSIKNIDNIKSISYILFYIFFLLFIIIYIILLKNNLITLSFLDINKIVITFIYMTIILLMLRLIKYKYINNILIILVISELFFNAFLATRDYEFYLKEQYNDYTHGIKDKMKVDFKNYRSEKDFLHSYNDSLIMNYNGISVFNSNIDMNIINFFRRNGYDTNNNTILYNNINPIIDSIIGLKRVVSKKDNLYYKKIDEFALPQIFGDLYGTSFVKYYVYENETASKLGFIIDKNAKNFKSDNMPLIYSSDILKAMMGNDYDYFNTYDSYHFNSKNDYPIYFYPNINYDICNSNTSVSININDDLYNFNNCKRYYFYIDSKKDEQINVELISNDGAKIDDVIIGYYDMDLIKKDIYTLNKQSFYITINNGRYIKGNIDVIDDNILFLSIPYSDNFKIKVDGKQVDYYKLFDTFIGLDIKKGNHIVEIEYNIGYLNISIIISITGFILLVIYNIYLKNIIMK